MSTLTAQIAYAFGAGATAFFSPCVFALLPGYVSYYVATVETERAPLVGATARGVAATGGALVTFGLLSAVALAGSELLERAIPVIEPFVGVVLVGLGVAIYAKGTLSVSVPLPKRRASVLGFGLFGTMYAVAATACVLPLFLSVAVQSFTLSTVGTVLVLGGYAAGFGLLMLAATVAVAVGHDALFGRMAGYTGYLTRAAAVLISLAGLAQIYVAVRVSTG